MGLLDWLRDLFAPRTSTGRVGARSPRPAPVPFREAWARRKADFLPPARRRKPSRKRYQRPEAICDPEALDRPTVLTIIGLGKRLAKHMLSG